MSQYRHRDCDDLHALHFLHQLLIVASISSASAGAMLLLLAMRRMFMLLFGFVEVVLARSLHFSNRLMLIKCFLVNISISKPQNRM